MDRWNALRCYECDQNQRHHDERREFLHIVKTGKELFIGDNLRHKHYRNKELKNANVFFGIVERPLELDRRVELVGSLVFKSLVEFGNYVFN